jgi:hypothetical protein
LLLSAVFLADLAYLGLVAYWSIWPHGIDASKALAGLRTNDLAIIGPLVIGAGGLVLAGYQAHLNSRERVAGHRHVLYEQQVLACLAITKAMDTFVVDGMSLINHAAEIGTTNAERKRISRAFRAVWRPYGPILPYSVYGAVQEANAVFLRTNRLASTKPLGLACGRVVREMRNTLGTEPLTRQTFEYIGVSENVGLADQDEGGHRPIDTVKEDGRGRGR